MAGSSVAHRYIVDDERPGRGTSASAGVQGSPQREPALPRRQLESRVAKAQVEFILIGAGLDRSPVGRRGQACSPANGYSLEEL